MRSTTLVDFRHFLYPAVYRELLQSRFENLCHRHSSPGGQSALRPSLRAPLERAATHFSDCAHVVRVGDRRSVKVANGIGLG